MAEIVLFIDSPVGELGIAEEDGAVTGIFFGRKNAPREYAAGETPLLAKAVRQLAEYFDGKRKAFDLPLNLRGTEFQRAVWGALQKIPYGETRTYRDIAGAVKNPKAFRAVGLANNRNPVSIVVPCHRVIGVDGSLTGYGGGLPAKQYLLGLESRFA